MAKTTRTRVIGTTRIIDSLGKGGMAEVFYGEQELLGREVAVKIMLPEIAVGDKAEERFFREARALAALQHENIVAIHDLIEKNDQLFMVIEYVEGVDVDELLGEVGQLPLDVALLIATGVVAALEHAHFRNVLHRDIKPANVMISTRGEVKLTDFGIAKDLSQDDLTRTGMVVGTPSYMAPELFEGKLADQRTDLYSVGVLLYQCLTGRKPFQGENRAQTIRAIATGERQRLRSLVGGVPRSVEKVVDRCLKMKPDKRYRRAAELHRALERELDRVLDGTPNARLVGYLHSRGHIDEDDLSVIDVDDLSFTVHEVVEDDESDENDIDSTTASGPRARRKRAASGDATGTEAATPNDVRTTTVRRSGSSVWVWLAFVLLVLVAGGLVWLTVPAFRIWVGGLF